MRSSRHRMRHAPTLRQRGVVLFVALIGMVVLSLAAVALLRSVDSGNSISGNLAFKQATVGPVNYAIEQANYALFEGPLIARVADLFNHDLTKNYYANLQAGEINGIPAILYGPSYVYPGAFQSFTDSAGNTIRWAIERMCAGFGPAPAPYFGPPLVGDGPQACDLMVPKVSSGRTTMKIPGIPVDPVPLYRVSIRIDGPANTVTYAQAMLR